MTQKDIEQAVFQIEQFELTEDGLKKFELAINKLIASEQVHLGVDALLSAFEKFPEEDAFGLFWTALHAIEYTQGYQAKVINSVKRQPSQITLAMIQRMLNSGVEKIGELQLSVILNDIAENTNYSKPIRKLAMRKI